MAAMTFFLLLFLLKIKYDIGVVIVIAVVIVRCHRDEKQWRSIWFEWRTGDRMVRFYCLLIIQYTYISKWTWNKKRTRLRSRIQNTWIHGSSRAPILNHIIWEIRWFSFAGHNAVLLDIFLRSLSLFPSLCQLLVVSCLKFFLLDIWYTTTVLPCFKMSVDFVA